MIRLCFAVLIAFIPNPVMDVYLTPTQSLEVCSTSDFKSWMDYRAITDQTSAQWALQQSSSTDVQGVRLNDGRLMVAMASTYGAVGDKLNILLSSGLLIEVVLGDIKAGTACEHPDTSMLEFIVDEERLDSQARILGNLNIIYPGRITRIIKE